MSFFLDASVIVPSFIRQDSSAAVDRFMSAPSDSLFVSHFAAAEVSSALSRLLRMKWLTLTAAETFLRDFDAWRADVALAADIHATDFRLADTFVRRFDLGLRAPDALHVAVCRRADHTLVTLDRRLANAAEALGVAVDCPA